MLPSNLALLAAEGAQRSLGGRPTRDLFPSPWLWNLGQVSNSFCFSSEDLKTEEVSEQCFAHTRSAQPQFSVVIMISSSSFF